MMSPKYTKFLKKYDALNTKHNEGIVTDAEFVNELLELSTAFCAQNKVSKLKEHIVDINDDDDNDAPDPFIVVFD